MSIGTVGSMCTKRSTKGLKRDILSSNRNRLSDGQACVLHRASENIRLLMKARIALSTKVQENSVLAHIK